MLLLKNIVHHIIWNHRDESIASIAFQHPSEQAEWNLRHVVTLQTETSLVSQPFHFQSYFKFDFEGEILNSTKLNPQQNLQLAGVLQTLSLLVIYDIIKKLQVINTIDDISLLNAIQKQIQYPLNYFPVDCDNPQAGLPGLGFYPVGRGLWNEQDRSLKNKRIMVLGQDFGGYEGYAKSIEDGKESENGPTWRNLLELLKDSKVDYSQVFFTNAVMGQRQKGLSSVKNDAWVKEKEFLQDNLDFLKLQILVQRPEVILVLGKEAFPIVKQLNPALEVLKADLSFENIDSLELMKHVNQEISLVGIPDYSFRLVLLVHPSYRHVNVAKRRFKTYSGKDAENQMVLEALMSKVQIKDGSIIKTSRLYLQENQSSRLSDLVLNPIFNSFEAQLNQLREQWFNYEDAETDLFNQNEATYCGMWALAIREAFPPSVPILEVAVYDESGNSVGRIDCLAQIILNGQTTNFIIEAKQWPYDGKEDSNNFDSTKRMFDNILAQNYKYYSAEKDHYKAYPTYLCTIIFEYLSKPEYVGKMKEDTDWDPHTHFFKLFHTDNCGLMVYGQIFDAEAIIKE